MKKVVGSLLMTSTILLGALTPIVGHAADGENRSGTTNATATFTANTTNQLIRSIRLTQRNHLTLSLVMAITVPIPVLVCH